MRAASTAVASPETTVGADVIASRTVPVVRGSFDILFLLDSGDVESFPRGRSPKPFRFETDRRGHA